jgi:HlyD family secretion protein
LTQQPFSYRRIALDRLSSADDLDRVLAVTGPRSWILLIALCVVMGTAVMWSSVAVVPLRVSGPGILLKSGGLLSVVSMIDGRLADLSVDVGDTVREGQVVARIAQPEIVERLQQAKVRLANLREGHAFLLSSGNKELQLRVEGLAQQSAHLVEAIKADEGRAKYFEAKVLSQQQLVDEGRLTRQTLINTVQELDVVRQEIRSRRNELAQLELAAVQARSLRDGNLQKSAFSIAEVENEVAQLERGITTGAEVRSPYTGRIVEIAVELGAVIDRGESLVTLNPTGRTVAALTAMAYVPAADGKRISPGMAVQIVPSTVKAEEFGYMLGKVTYVSDLPATARSMMRALKSEELVKAMMGTTPPHEVHIDLLPDPSTASGYRWSSAQGPPIRIESGTLCQAAIIVDSRHPIEMVVPFFRRTGGV